MRPKDWVGTNRLIAAATVAAHGDQLPSIEREQPAKRSFTRTGPTPSPDRIGLPESEAVRGS